MIPDAVSGAAKSVAGAVMAHDAEEVECGVLQAFGLTPQTALLT